MSATTFDARPLARLGGALHSFVRGRQDDAPWERPALVGLLALTAVLYLVNLAASGWANSFYSAAAQAGSVDWTAFFYGSSDAANSITVDKPPASLWLMALSVRLFGLSSFSILLPQALMGIATVGTLYAMVRRRFPAGTALLAGATLAITPVAALMFRFNNPDALLVLLTTLALYFTLRGVETGKLKWVLWAGVMVGFAFLTKQLQGFLVLPVLGLVYLWAAPLALRTRLWHALAALGAVVVSAGWWVAVVQLVPASLRPYIGGSQTNSFLELTFGYNGFGRLTGQETGSVTGGGQQTGGATGGGQQMWGETGLLRLFSGDVGGQISWLLPAAILSMVVALILMRRRPRTSAARALLLLLGGTLLVTALAFSFMAGIFHAYYTVALAPALAGTVAIGVGMIWSRRSRLWSRVTMAALVIATVLLAWTLLDRAAGWLPWLKFVILALGVVAAVLLLLTRGGRRMQIAAAAIALAATLLGPFAYTLQTISTGHTGSIVSAGPAVSGSGAAGGGGRPTGGPGALGAPSSQGGSQSFTGGPGPGSGPGPGGASTYVGGTNPAGPAAAGGLLNVASVSPTLAKLLVDNATSYRWIAATVGSEEAAGYQLATGYSVMPVGGFNGSDPSPTLAQFQALVTQHQIHWFIGGSGGKPNGGSSDSTAIAAWVAATFTATTEGNSTIYDLTK